MELTFTTMNPTIFVDNTELGKVYVQEKNAFLGPVMRIDEPIINDNVYDCYPFVDFQGTVHHISEKEQVREVRSAKVIIEE